MALLRERVNKSALGRKRSSGLPNERDTAAVEQLWREYRAQLLSFIRQRVTDPPLAEDLLQEVFVKIQAKLPALAEPAHLRAWLYQIARNAIIDSHRTHRRFEELPKDLAATDDQDQRVLRELAQCMSPLVDRLPYNYRNALRLSELEGLPLKVVAERQGLSLSGAKSRVQRGRKQLKHLLLECCAIEFNRRGQAVEYESKSGGECPAC